MNYPKRKFNKTAYDDYDLSNKLELKNLMEKKGYNLIGDINEEHYKKYDLIFKHSSSNKILAFENETRANFDKIKSYYNTIHIPIRKKNTQADYYIVWNKEMTQFFLIPYPIINKYIDNVVNVKCVNTYLEDFIDIPKVECQLFTKNKEGNWKLQLPI
jgi:hypothetical protein